MVDSRKDRSRFLASLMGSKVAQRRKALGWTQDNLAEQMGVDAETVSRIERGVHLPSLLTLARVADTLRCEPGELLSAEPLAERTDLEMIAVWLHGLKDEDRLFALESLRRLADHLRANQVKK